MKKAIILFGIATLALTGNELCHAQTTPLIGLNLPVYAAPNWNVPLNQNFTILDNYLGGVNSFPNPLKASITGVAAGSLPLTGGTLTGSLLQTKHSAFGAQASVDYTYPAILLNGPASTLGPSVLGIYENSSTPVGVNGAVIQTGWTPASSPSGYPNATLIVDQEANVDSTSAGTATPLGMFVQVNNNGNTVSDSTIGLSVETNNAGNAPQFENIALLLQSENYGSGTVTGAYGVQAACYNFGTGTIGLGAFTGGCDDYAAYAPQNTGGGVIVNWAGFYVGTDGAGAPPVNAYGVLISQVTGSSTSYQIYSAGTAKSYFAGPMNAQGFQVGTAGSPTEIISSAGIVEAGGGTNTVYRCTNSGGTLPTGTLTITSGDCGTSSAVSLKVN
jgi:hypothetical protein